VIGICRAEGVSEYVNAAGGRNLYDPEAFRNAGIELKFLEPWLPAYEQGIEPFEAGLSILDVVMRAPESRVREMLWRFHQPDG